MEDRAPLCARCGSLDRVQKVTAIIHSGRTKSVAGGLGAGLAGVGLGLGGTATETELATLLAAPLPPTESSLPREFTATEPTPPTSEPFTPPTADDPRQMVVGGIAALCLAAICLVRRHYSPACDLEVYAADCPPLFQNHHPFLFLIGWLFTFAGIVGLLNAASSLWLSSEKRTAREKAREREASERYARKQANKIERYEKARADYDAKKSQYESEKAAYETAHEKWQRDMEEWKGALARWNALHYCARCDGVFVSGEGFAPIEDVKAYMYRQPLTLQINRQ